MIVVIPLHTLVYDFFPLVRYNEPGIIKSMVIISKLICTSVLEYCCHTSKQHGWNQRGGGRGSGPPLKNHKNIGFPSNVDPHPLKSTKLPSRLSKVGHYRHASETLF